VSIRSRHLKLSYTAAIVLGPFLACATPLACNNESCESPAHLPESSVEILGRSVGGITYRHHAHRAPLAFKAVMTLPQPTDFLALLKGCGGGKRGQARFRANPAYPVLLAYSLPLSTSASSEKSCRLQRGQSQWRRFPSWPVEGLPMPESVYCAHCQRVLEERELTTHVLTLESCSKCRSVVRQSEFQRHADVEKSGVEDVTAIAAWFATVRREFRGVEVEELRAGEDAGEHRWVVRGLQSPWRCEVRYQQKQPHIVQVLLCSDIRLPEVFRTERLRPICAARGVQVFGESTVLSLGADGKKTGTPSSLWGSAVFYNTGILDAELLDGAVWRLNEVMRDAATGFGVPIPEQQ
jgi:hypothetical protein